MCYEQADYEAEMNAAGEAEAEAAYDEYLQGLLDSGQSWLYALEVVTRQLKTSHFSESNLTALEYLEKEKLRMLNPVPINRTQIPRILGVCWDCGEPCASDKIECDRHELPF